MTSAANESCTSKKRNRSEFESSLDEDNSNMNSNHSYPPQKKPKYIIDPCDIFSKFITDAVRPSIMINSINAISDAITQRLVSTELMNSYFKIQKENRNGNWGSTHRTLLAQIIYNVEKLEGYTKPNIQLLTSLKQLLILILNNGADPMLKQQTNSYYICIENTSLPTSTNIFHQLSSPFFKNIKFDFYLFTNANDLQISILNISTYYSRWYDNYKTRHVGYYFADHICQSKITTEFTFDIGIKALCWFPLILIFNESYYQRYHYQEIIRDTTEYIKGCDSEIINDKDILINTINTINDSMTSMPVWSLHLFILKEYYKIYPIQFAKCLLDHLPMDIINILKDYCIPQYDYSWLDINDTNDTNDTVLDEHAWIVGCLHNIYRFGNDWKTIFYQIIMRNTKYRDFLLDFSLANKYKDIYSSIYELICNDGDLLENICNQPTKLVHFIARSMEFGHKEFLSKLLVNIGEKYEFNYDLFIASDENVDTFDWCDILNFCIMEYGNDTVRKSMFNEICDYIRKYCLNDKNIMFNVMDKLWTKREWINNTKWTKYRLECLKILKNKLNLAVNKVIKYCYLRQNGTYKISSIKLVETILKYKKERKTLLNYNICKEKNYLRNIENIINYDKPLPNKMIKTVHQLIVSFKQWKNENRIKHTMHVDISSL